MFCEDIDKTQEGGRTELEDYIYLDIIPAGNRTVGPGHGGPAASWWMLRSTPKGKAAANT